MSSAVLTTLVDDFTARHALRAGSFIVTFYGDVILPRGGSVWIGNVIEMCRVVGINESQARTAISRLTEAGRLTGLRSGRRSFYHLTDAAAAEFEAAAHAIHGPGAAPEDAPWTLVRVAGDAAAVLATLGGLGFGAMAPSLALKPGDCRAEVRATLGGGRRSVLFTARPEQLAAGSLAALAADTWDLDGLSAVYADFTHRFQPLTAAFDAGQRLGGAESLVARLLLVHEFRRIALRDPGLPVSALPADWAGTAARALFRRCYDRLTAVAERHVLSHFVDAEGPLRPVPRLPRIARGSNAA
ncbi:MAG: PaaX family transcriptional regulator [Rhodospirillaceae bacterium]|nr:PaaX family transcriptional regulator [Rhodospirillaceae bacterium]